MGPWWLWLALAGATGCLCASSTAGYSARLPAPAPPGPPDPPSLISSAVVSWVWSCFATGCPASGPLVISAFFSQS